MHSRLMTKDYRGLTDRFGHVRLDGNLAVNLVNWTTCPGSNWVPSFGISEAEEHQLVKSRIKSDPEFLLFKEAAFQIVAAGLKLILNPLHTISSLTVNEAFLRRFWAVIIDEFPRSSFPEAQVAFEVANELGNFGNQRLDGNLGEMLSKWAEQVHQEQPSRILVMPGGAMGYAGTLAHPNSNDYRQSWEAVVSDAPAVFSSFSSFSQYPIISTFRFSSPRSLTPTRGLGNGDYSRSLSPTTIPSGKSMDSPLAASNSSADPSPFANVSYVSKMFDAVRKAVPHHVPLYLAEVRAPDPRGTICRPLSFALARCHVGPTAAMRPRCPLRK